VSLKERIPDLHVLFLGSGPAQRVVETACARYSWMHFIGPVYGAQRAIYFAISQVLLMPGLVGLAIIDSFVAEVPLFTTEVPIHSPEIFYLKHGVNGVMTTYSAQDYAAAVAYYLADPQLLAGLRDGCREGARRYTLDHMVDNFVGGVQECLAAARR
jgi:glycosyltransferase involved in cell wall biosynthesis